MLKPETVTVLYKVSNKLAELREILDDHMYRGAQIPDEDHKKCREVYDSICQTLDLL